MMEDEQIKGSILIKKYAVIAPGYKIQAGTDDSKGTEIKEFVEDVIIRMPGSFVESLLQLMTSFTYGFSVSELVYEIIDRGRFKGKIGLKNIKTKDPAFYEFETDRFGNLLNNGLILTGISVSEKSLPINKFIIWPYQKEFDNWYGRSDLREAFRCYSDDTEVLTIDGWKLFKDVDEKDELATLNQNNGYLEYHKYINKYEYEYDGELFNQTGRYIDLLVTPNHRMWVSTRKNPEFKFVEAKDLERKVCFKRDTNWNGKEQDFFIFPEMEYVQTVYSGNDKSKKLNPHESIGILEEKKIPMDYWLAFLGIWLAEGSICYKTKKETSRYEINISQNLKNKDKCETISNILTNCGFNWRYNTKGDTLNGTFSFNSKQVCKYLSQFGTSREKFIPKEIKNLSQRQLKILYDSMAMGDGTRNNQTYITSSKKLADDVQEILFKIGYGTTVAVKKERKNCFSKNEIYYIGINNRRIDATLCNEHKDNRKFVKYSGKVYCVEVPNNLLYVRRNGKACWCGNSWNAKDFTIKAMNIWLERFASPLVKGTYKGSDSSKRNKLQQVLDNISTATNIVMPKDSFDIEFIESKGKGEARYLDALNFHNIAISRAILIPDRLVAAGEKGAFAQSKTHFDMFIINIQAIRRILEELLDEQFIKRVVDLNFPNVEKYPKFKFNHITDAEKRAVFEKIVEAIEKGALIKSLEDENFLRESLGMKILPAGTDVTPMLPKKEETTSPKSRPKEEESEDEEEPEEKENKKSFALIDRELTSFEKVVDFKKIEKDLDTLEEKTIDEFRKVLIKQRDVLTEFITKKSLNNELTSKLILDGIDLRYTGELKRIAKDSLVNAYSNGRKDGNRELTKKFALKHKPGFEITPDKAISFLESKGIFLADRIKDKLNIEIKEILIEAVRRGEGVKEIVKKIEDLYEPYVASGEISIADKILKPFRIEALVRTNINQAYNEGRYSLGEDPDLEGFVIGYQFSEILDNRSVPVSFYVDSKIINIKDPMLSQLRYPLHWGERGIHVYVTKDNLPVTYMAEEEKARAISMKNYP